MSLLMLIGVGLLVFEFMAGGGSETPWEHHPTRALIRPRGGDCWYTYDELDEVFKP